MLKNKVILIIIAFILIVLLTPKVSNAAATFGKLTEFTIDNILKNADTTQTTKYLFLSDFEEAIANTNGRNLFLGAVEENGALLEAKASYNRNTNSTNVVNRRYANCAGHGHNSTMYIQTGSLDSQAFRIDAVIEIDTPAVQEKVGAGGKPGAIWATSVNKSDGEKSVFKSNDNNKNARKAALKLAYVAYGASSSSNDYGYSSNEYKALLRTIAARNVGGLYDYLGIPKLSQTLNSNNQLTTTTNDAYSSTKTQLEKDADAYANSVEAYKFDDKTASSTKIIAKNEVEGDKVVAYVGPYTIETNATISEWTTANGPSLKGFSTTIGGDVKTRRSDLTERSNKVVYFVTDGEVKNKNFKITLKRQFERYYAKIMFAAQGGSQQHVSLYAAGKGNVTKELILGIDDIVPATVDLKLTKKDTKTGKPMSNVGFIIKVVEGENNGKYIGKNTSGNATFNTSASTLPTDRNGILEIKKIPKNCKIEIVEVNNPFPYASTYEVKYKEIKQTINLKSVSGTTYNLNVTNTKTHLHVQGTVWEDHVKLVGKDGREQNKLLGSEDKRVDGIKVTLKNKSDNRNPAMLYNPTSKRNDIRAEAITDKNGFYRFENVDLEELAKNNYYIEFEYNGMKYESITTNLTNINGSKASDTQASRDTLNNNYETINANSKVDYYDIKDHRSETKYIAADPSKYSNEYYAQNGYHVIGSTNGIYNMALQYDKNNLQQDTIVVNYGIQLRDQPALSVVKDIESAKVTINGAEHVYKYSDKRRDIQGKLEETFGSDYDAGVKFQDKRDDMEYTRALYPSDVKYTGDKKLEVKITYRIGIKNQVYGLKSTINELTDYYDSKYEIDVLGVGRAINSDGSIKAGTGLSYTKLGAYSKDGNYQKIKIEPKFTIDGEKEEFVFVELRVRKDKIDDIIDRNQTVKLDNIVEITSYSTKDGSGNKRAGIDKNSRPGNIEADVSNKALRENDTNRAPGLKIVATEERVATGTVFIDDSANKDDIMTAQMRQGSGALDSADKGLKGVEVQLIKASDGSIAKTYDEVTKKTEKDARVETDDNGNYTIKGFIPDDYYLKYTWGNKEYIVQDYKGTTVDKGVWDAKNSNDQWYKDEFKRNYASKEWNMTTGKEIRASDAIDDYDLRQEIDKQNSMVMYGNKEVLREYSGDADMQDKDGTTTKLKTKMNSTTPKFKVNIEYSTGQTSIDDEYNRDTGEPISTFKNTIKSIDFGITQRPKQALVLDKQIKRTKIILSDGNVLIDAEIENGKLKGNVNHTTFLPGTSNAESQLKVEIDQEIVQGAKVEIEYELKVTNVSELDYVDKGFYHFGINQNVNTLVKLSPNKVIDYLDNNISADITDESNNDWKILSFAEKMELMTDKTVTEELDLTLKNTSKVITTDKLGEELIPADGKNESTAIINTYRLLANNMEDSTFDNDAEIVKIIKNGGSSITTTPGNYIPNKSEQTRESDDASSGSLIILPPTGLSVDYIAYAILAISALGISVFGIVLIKKFVIKRKDSI